MPAIGWLFVLKRVDKPADPMPARVRRKMFFP
jgi:hypothetical protein